MGASCLIIGMAQIKKQTFQSTIFSYLSAAVGLVTQGYVIPNFFATDQNGLISLFLSLMLLLPLFANLGFNGAGTRYFPYFRDAKTNDHGYVFLALLFSFIGFIIVVVALWFFKDGLIEEYQKKSLLLVRYYPYLLPIVAFMLIFNVFDVYSRLHYDSVTGTFLSQFVLRLNNLVVALLYAFRWINFDQFMMIWCAGISLPMILIVLKTIREGRFSLRPDFGFLKQSQLLVPILKFCALSIIASLSSQIVLYIDKIMITDMIDLNAVGVYSTASFFGTVIAMPMIAMQLIAGTIVAEAWKNNDHENIAKIYQKSCLVQLFVGLWVFLGICVNLDNIFEFLPPAYEAGRWVIVWIGLSKVLDMATGINGTILNTSKYYYLDTIFFIVLIFCTVLLNHQLIPTFGIEGAAIGAVVSVFIYNLCRYGLLWYLFGFQPFNSKNAIVVGMGIAAFGLVSLLPSLTGSPIAILGDMAYRSVTITLLFVGGFYVSGYSPEFNQQCTTIYQKLWGIVGKPKR